MFLVAFSDFFNINSPINFHECVTLYLLALFILAVVYWKWTPTKFGRLFSTTYLSLKPRVCVTSARIESFSHNKYIVWKLIYCFNGILVLENSSRHLVNK